MAQAQLTSKIDAVKIYAAGATVTRIAELHLTPNSLPEQVEIPGLPLALDDSSVRVRVESVETLHVTSLQHPIASDIRIGLAVPPPPEIPDLLPDEELRAAVAEVKRLEDIIALIDREIAVLSQLEVPDRPEGESGKAPPPSPMGARLALANFSDEQIRARMQEKRESLDSLHQAKENWADLEQKQRLASTARNARPNELRKTAIVSLSYEGEFATEQQTQLVIEYFVPGARWTPTYVCRLNSVDSSANIAVRALICQQTGEDWSGVRLELSTALPMSWCALPELPSLRLGKAQPVVRKTGWRIPPVGAEILFEDYDRQKKFVLASESNFLRTFNLYSPSVPPLQDVREYLDLDRLFEVAFGEAMQKLSDPRSNAAFENTSGFSSEMLSNEFAFAGEAMQDDAFEELYDMSSQLFSENTTPEPTEPPEFLRRLRRKIPASAPAAARLSQGALGVSFDQSQIDDSVGEITDNVSDRLLYNLMRLGAPDDSAKRSKLSIEQRHEVYLEILQRQKVVVNFNITRVVQQAISTALNSLYINLPPGGINVREVAGSFDYAYSADGRIDVPSDNQFHSVALTNKTTNVDVRYIVVPREDTNVFRIAELCNPLPAPLLSGPADVYVDGEYILSTNIATVPPKGKMEIGLGVEQGIKVARNTFYQESRSGIVLVAFNELQHKIKIEIANRLSKEARIEVRERIPVPQEGAKVDVQINGVTPDWEKYEQEERGKPIEGGYRWRVKVPGGRKATLEVDYTIKTYVDSELIGGNRREE